MITLELDHAATLLETLLSSSAKIKEKNRFAISSLLRQLGNELASNDGEIGSDYTATYEFDGKQYKLISTGAETSITLA